MKPNFHQIYFALDPSTDRVKIGRTRQHLSERMRDLTIEHALPEAPRPMYVFATFDYTAEQSIHLLLREYRVEGEWFLNGIHIEIAVQLWLKHGSFVENLRIVDRHILIRDTGKRIDLYIPSSGGLGVDDDTTVHRGARQPAKEMQHRLSLGRTVR